MENQPFLLVELEDLSPVLTALKTTSRIKYTCFNVSNNYLIFGATSGGLYVFRREPCCFLQILPNKEGSVTQVSLSPDEKLIAFSTVRGIVCVLEKSAHGARLVVTTLEHQNEQITCLQWNEDSNELFIGDNLGKVSILTVSVFPTKSMFQNPSFVLMQLDSKIVQMDFCCNMLLVSTLTKCYICDTSKEIYRQVGHKLRDGEYGACIFNTQINVEVNSDFAESNKNSEYSNLSHLRLLCARPGSRIWEVAIDGTVIRTHHFKEALAVPPKKIYFLNNSHENNKSDYSILTNGTFEQNSHVIEQSFNFQKLFVVLPQFFLTFKSNGIYIFDPQKVCVVLWNNEITNINDVKCMNDVLYVWSGHGKMYALNLLPLEKFLIHLYFQKKYLELAKVCLEYERFLLTHIKDSNELHILHDLGEKLKSHDLENCLKPFINLCKENFQKKLSQNAQKLQSAIYLFSKNSSLVLEDKKIGSQKLLRPSYLNLKVRSHSVSPERLQNGELKHQSSCTSLPDLMKAEKLVEVSSSPNDVIVNGKKTKETVLVNTEEDVENILNMLNFLENLSEPSKEKIFLVLDELLNLCKCENLDLVQSLPLDSYFNQENLNKLSNFFHFTLKSKYLFEWLSKFSGDWLANALRLYPSFMTEKISSEDLELDFRLSKILALFSKILKEEEIVEAIRQTEIKCYFASLCEILEIYRDSTISSTNLEKFTSTPKLLNRIYFLMNVGQINQCSKYSHQINLHDMFYLTLKLEKDSIMKISSGFIELQCGTMFLSYLEKTYNAKKIIADCDDIIVEYIINCLENVINAAGGAKKSKCDCGFPMPCLHPYVAAFPNIGQALLEKYWPANVEKCMEICTRIPYLWKFLIYLHRNRPLLDLLTIILQTGEIQEIENRREEMNKEVFEVLLQKLINLKKGFCLNCGKVLETSKGAISWTVFGALSIKLSGPSETLELYKKYSQDINSKELDQSFFQTLVFSAIMEKHSQGLRKNVVDMLTKRNMEVPCEMFIFSETIYESLFGKKFSTTLNCTNSKNNSHHWGAKVNFKSNCPICSLPLETKVLIKEAGLVVFKCAHAFHSACLKKNNFQCPVCRK